jgi:hypothetical protein
MGLNIHAQSDEILSDNRIEKLNKHASKTTFKEEKSIPVLVEFLVKPTKNDLEKAWILYYWIAHNIQYDTRGFNTNKYDDPSPENVLRKRKGVCAGFASLFSALGEAAGLEIEKISGYAKGYGYNRDESMEAYNHVWNVIRIEGEWKLMDVTWGQGYGINRFGSMSAKAEFDPFWFATNPKEFIFTHLPSNSAWQLLDSPISKTQFEQLPVIAPEIFLYGINMDSVFRLAITNPDYKYVAINDLGGGIQIVEAPLSEKIEPGISYTWIIKAPDAIEVAAINNDQWTMFEEKGDRFVLTMKPETGKLFIGIKFDKKGDSFCSFLRYKVKP